MFGGCVLGWAKQKGFIIHAPEGIPLTICLRSLNVNARYATARHRVIASGSSSSSSLIAFVWQDMNSEKFFFVESSFCGEQFHRKKSVFKFGSRQLICGISGYDISYSISCLVVLEYLFDSRIVPNLTRWSGNQSGCCSVAISRKRGGLNRPEIFVNRFFKIKVKI